MKKIVFLCLIFLLPSIISAEENTEKWTTYVNIDNGQNQTLLGGSEGNSNGGKNKLVTNISPYANSGLPSPPPAIYDPKETKPWCEKSFFRYTELDSPAEIDAFLEGKKDIFQGTKKPIKIEENKDPIIILKDFPKNPYLPELFAFSLNGPENGLNRETYRRAASIAKLVTNTRHILLLPITDIYSENVLRAMGFAPGASWLFDAASTAVGGSITKGSAKTRTLRAPYVMVICYPNPSYIDRDAYRLLNQDKISSEIPTENLQTIILGVIPFYEKDLDSIIPKIRQAVNKRKNVGFEGVGFDNTLSEKMAEKVLNMVAEKIPEASNLFSFRAKIQKDNEEIKTLTEKQISGVVVIKIIK